jgi:hypothetical protein
LAPGAEGRLEWTADVSRAGMKTLVWRYRNRAVQTVPAALKVNGVAAAPDLAFAPTAEADAWMSLSAETYLNTGSNTIVLNIPSTAESDLLLDRLEIIDADDNVAQYRVVTYSNQTDASLASAALDGRLASCWWMSQYPQWLEIDLGQPYPIDRVKLTGRSTGPCRFDVETKLRTEDAYQQVVDCRDRAEALAADAPVVNTFARTSARYVRLNIVGGADGEAVDVQEFGVFVSMEQAAITVGAEDYRTIQEALAAAEAGATVTLQPGLYAGPGNGDVHWGAKALTLTSVDANDPEVVATTVLEGTAAAPVVSVSDLEPESRVVGLTITGGLAGVLCQNASPGIERCRIVDNQGPGIEMQVKSDPIVRNTIICANEGAGILMVSKLGARTPVYNAPDIVNCTLAHNAAEGAAGGKFTMRNCIVWGNGADAGTGQLSPVEATVSYSCIQGGFAGEGNTETDPLFLADGDYHLAVGSPCIDAGDPGDAIDAEPAPCGGRINMGAYGGSVEATTSLGN